MSFDSIIDRRGTGSLKWDKCPSLLPFWVADMDFASPPEVIEALLARVRHGVFGYATPHPGLGTALEDYLARRFRYEMRQEIIHLGGLVPALSLAARAFGQPGDELLTCTPVYPPFLSVGKDAQMATVTVPHLWGSEAGRWSFDWDGLARAVTPRTRLFLLSNPQNPLGRCFSADEIMKIGQFCLEHGILLVSDEVHCDLVLDESKTPFCSALNLPDEVRKNSIVLLSPSKTYNIAGLGYAFAVIEEARIAAKFRAARGHTMPEINCLAYFAAEAAYRHGEPWRQGLLDCLRNNRDLLAEFTARELKGIQLDEIEATYLAWMDCSALALSRPAEFFEKHGLFLSDGAFFHASRHVRFNFGCPPARVQEGLDKMKAALGSIADSIAL